MSEEIIINESESGSEPLEYIEVVNPSLGTIDGAGDMIVISERNSNVKVINPTYIAENVANKKNDLTNPDVTGYTSTLAVYNALLLKANTDITVTGVTNLGSGYFLGSGITTNKINIKSLVAGNAISLSSTNNTITINVDSSGVTGFVTTPTFIAYTGNTKSIIDDKLNTTIFNSFTGSTLPSSYYNKSQIDYYTGTTAPNIYFSNDSFNIYSGTTIPNTYYSKSEINNYTGTTDLAYVTAIGAVTDTETSFNGGIVLNTIRPTGDTISAILINKSDGVSNIINIDTISGLTGYGTMTPKGLVHAFGSNSVTDDEDTQTNAFIIDGITEVDKDINWSDNGQAKWLAEIYRGEEGKIWYLYNVPSYNAPLTITETGRIGVNKNTNILDYHAAQIIGTGLNDLEISGEYTQNYNTVYEIKINSNGIPDTYVWRKSVDDGLTYSGWSLPSGTTITPIELEYGVNIQFYNETGHTVGDTWQFAAFTQIPQGTFTIAPLPIAEVQHTNNYTLNPIKYNDITSIANGGTDDGQFTIFDTGTGGTYQALYIGTAVQSNSIFFSLKQNGESIVLVVEYWNGNNWIVLNASNLLYDDTNNLSRSGIMTWSLTSMNGWTKAYIPDLIEEGYELFWMRIRTTTNPTISPIGNSISGGGGKRFSVYTSYNSYRPAYYIDTLGRINIGGGNISGKNVLQINNSNYVDVTGGQSNSLFEIDSNCSDVANIRLRVSSNDSIGSGLVLAKTRGTLESGNNVISGDSLGNICFRARVNNVGAYLGGLEMQYVGNSNTLYSDILFSTSSGSLPTEKLRISRYGSGFGGITHPTARIHIQSGSTSIAPIKFITGNLLNIPQAGAMEFSGNNWYGTTTGSTRKTFAFLESPIFVGSVSLPSDTTLNDVNLNDFILYSAATYNDLITQKEEFDIYTGNTDIRLNSVDNDITYISGITDSKLNTSTFAIYTGSTIPWSNVSKSGSTLADLQTRNAIDINLNIPNWNINNVDIGLNDITEYIENTNITGRIAPVDVLFGTRTNTLKVSGGTGYINYSGYHRKIAWSGQTFYISGSTTEGIYYVYVDSDSKINIVTSEPNNEENIILGTYYFGGYIGVIQQSGIISTSSSNRIVDSLIRQGIFIYDNGGLVQLLSGSTVKIVSSPCKIQYGLIPSQLIELSSDNASTYQFLHYYNSADYRWSLNYHFNVMNQGKIYTNRWNDITKNSAEYLSGYTVTFTQYSNIVTSTSDLTAYDLENSFIYFSGDSDIYATPVSGVTWDGSGSTITLETMYVGSGGSGMLVANYTLPKLASNKYAKHLIVRSNDNSMFLVLGQITYDSLDDARNGVLPSVPDGLINYAIKMAYIVNVGESTDLTGGIYDIRPLPYSYREGGQSGGGSTISKHGDLTGLDADDHLQYLRTDGTRNLTGIQRYNSHPTFTGNNDLVDKKYTDDADSHKLNISTFTGFTDITLTNNYYNKSQINIYTGTTVPNNYYNKTQINNYSGDTNNLINDKLNSSIFNNYTGNTAPNTFASKSNFNTYTGTTVPNTYSTISSFNMFTGTTLPNNYYNKIQITGYSANTKLVIDSKAYLSGATFTGVVRVPKPAQNDNTTCAATTSWYISQGGTANPTMNGIAGCGTSNLFARQDHVHPTDTSRLAVSIYTGYTATTVPNTYLSNINFNVYSGTSAPNQFASKILAITGATNLGTGTTLYTNVNTNKIQLKSIKSVGNLSVSNDSNHIILSAGTVNQIITATFILGAGTLITTGNNKTNILYVPKSGTITKVLAYAKTAPTGADAIFDINKNGTSIWNSTQANRIKIIAGNNSGSQTSFDTTALTAEDILTIDIDQIGSTIAGQDITLQVFITTQ